jgi:purine-cytosine permease-like protein
MNTYFIVYLIGYGLMIAAVWFGLDAAGVAQTWKLVALLFLLGLGIVYAWSQAQTDTAQREQARGGAGADRGGGTPQQSGTPQQGGNPQT